VKLVDSEQPVEVEASVHRLAAASVLEILKVDHQPSVLDPDPQ
jgi:hypothetical protein